MCSFVFFGRERNGKWNLNLVCCAARAFSSSMALNPENTSTSINSDDEDLPVPATCTTKISVEEFRFHLKQMMIEDRTDMNFMQMDDNLWERYLHVMEDELSCSVCFAVMVRPVCTLECTHKFCANCLLEWGADKESLTCPTCRAVIKNMMRLHSLDIVTEAVFDCHPQERVRLERDELRRAHSTHLDKLRLLYKG